MKTLDEKLLKKFEMDFKILKADTSDKKAKDNYDCIDSYYQLHRTNKLIYPNEKIEKMARRFFDIWKNKRDDIKKQFIDNYIDENDRDVDEMIDNNQNIEQCYYEEEITGIDIDEAIADEKLKVIKLLNNTKDIVIKKQELIQYQSESLKQIDEQLEKGLHNMKTTNKELQVAYLYDTKTKTNKIKTTTTTAGGIIGTVMAPIGGTIVGGGLGYVIGNSIQGKIVDKTESNFKKMRTD